MIDGFIFILHLRGSEDGDFIFGRILTRLEVDGIASFPIDFFPRKFAACSKPPSRDKHRKPSCPRTHQRDQGVD